MTCACEQSFVEMHTKKKEKNKYCVLYKYVKSENGADETLQGGMERQMRDGQMDPEEGKG